MAGFSSFSDMISEITTNGKSLQSVFAKTSANGASLPSARWAEFYTATGIPGPGPQTGTAGTGTNIAQSVQGTGIYIGSNVSTDIRSLLTAQVTTRDSGMVPGYAILCDFLVYWPALVVTGTPTTLTAAALGRYTNGKGVQAIVSVQTALGAAVPSLTLTCTYDDDASAAAAQAVVSPANSLAISGLFDYNGTPFVPLPSGKTGIKAITSYVINSGSTTGTVCFFLVKPLMAIPLLDTYIATERDLVVQMPSMPRVYDDAHLGWIVQNGSAMNTSAVLQGMLGMGWG